MQHIRKTDREDRRATAALLDQLERQAALGPRRPERIQQQASSRHCPTLVRAQQQQCG